MLSRPVGLALVAVGCIAAAGFGAYLAVRHNTSQVAAPAAVAPATPAGTKAAPLGGGVAETEAIVDERAPAPPAPAPAPVKPAVPEKRPSARAAAPVAPPLSEPAPAPAPAENWKGLDRSWPTRSADTAPEATVPAVGEPLALEPPPRVFVDLVVPAQSVIGLQIETPVSTKTAQIEDKVEARVIRDVMVDGRVAVPAGTKAIGSVTLVERGGKIKNRARLGVRFHTLVMADASRLPIQTDSIFREGEAPTQESMAKIGGGAVAGAILGAILGGGKGAIIGGATGAGGGTAAAMAGEPNPATLNVGSTVTVRLTAPATVTVER